MSDTIRVTVWNEFRHERKNDTVRSLYPDGMHQYIAGFLTGDGGIDATTATLDEPEHGLTEQVLAATDVLVWWGHMAHGEVQDEIVDRVQQRVLAGMGLVVLHSGHFSKPFKRLLGTTGSLRWRCAAEKERLWNIAPDHPITQGIGDCIELPAAEMYGERFDIPEPERLIFISWFEGGEVFRSGCTWTRGRGRIFYFKPGHETYPIFHHTDIQRVITNGVRWAAPDASFDPAVGRCTHVKQPLETIAAEEQS